MTTTLDGRNVGEADQRANADRPLTRSLDLTEQGDAMKATETLRACYNAGNDTIQQHSPCTARTVIVHSDGVSAAGMVACTQHVGYLFHDNGPYTVVPQ